METAPSSTEPIEPSSTYEFEESPKWYHNNWYLLFAFLLFWPAGLYGLYQRSNNKTLVKNIYILIGVIILIAAIFDSPSSIFKNSDQKEAEVIVQSYMNTYIRNAGGYQPIGFENFKVLKNKAGKITGYSIVHIYKAEVTYGGTVQYKYSQKFVLDKNLNIRYVYDGIAIAGPFY